MPLPYGPYMDSRSGVTGMHISNIQQQMHGVQQYNPMIADM